MSRESWEKVPLQRRIYLKLSNGIVENVCVTPKEAARWCHCGRGFEVRWIEMTLDSTTSWVNFKTGRGHRYFYVHGAPHYIKWDGVRGCIDHTPTEDEG